MTEQDLLSSYDNTAYEKLSASVDVVLLTVDAAKLQVLLLRRGDYPFQGRWSLPGGFLGMTETAEETAIRKLKDKARVQGVHIEQLCTMTGIERDPRMRVVSIAYLSLVSRERLRFALGEGASDIALFTIERDGQGRCRLLREGDGEASPLLLKDLAFDHGRILDIALTRLAGKLDYTDVGFSLLRDPAAFTILELRQVYEAVLGHKLDPANFRREMRKKYLDTGKVIDTKGKVQRTTGPRAKAYEYVGSGS